MPNKPPKTVSDSAKELSRRGAARGGSARAARLSPLERSEAARKAARARWGTTVPTAPWTGELEIGDRLIECAVTEEGIRLIGQGTMLTALGRSRRPKSDGVHARRPRPSRSQRQEVPVAESVSSSAAKEETQP